MPSVTACPRASFRSLRRWAGFVARARARCRNLAWSTPPGHELGQERCHEPAPDDLFRRSDGDEPGEELRRMGAQGVRIAELQVEASQPYRARRPVRRHHPRELVGDAEEQRCRQKAKRKVPCLGAHPLPQLALPPRAPERQRRQHQHGSPREEPEAPLARAAFTLKARYEVVAISPTIAARPTISSAKPRVRVCRDRRRSVASAVSGTKKAPRCATCPAILGSRGRAR